MKAKLSNQMTNVEMLLDIRNDTHEVGKECKQAFDSTKSITSGRLMNQSYTVAIRAMREGKRYNVLP